MPSENRPQVEALALHLAEADGVARGNTYAATAYRSGVDAARDYWDALATAALAAAKPEQPDQYEDRLEPCVCGSNNLTAGAHWPSGKFGLIRCASCGIEQPSAKPEQPAQGGQALVERVAAAIAGADHLEWDEPCGLETDPDGDCDSGTCVAAHFEDHDPEFAREWRRRLARAAIAALRTAQPAPADRSKA